MTSGIEAAGDMVSGALVARATEPGHGEAVAAEAVACLNCGAALTGPYCAGCGQNAHIHRTLTAFWHDLAHGVFHFEGKVWRTLPMLGWKPGELTRRYIHGERARFLSPLALFLFSVFLMFAVFEGVGGPIHPLVDVNGKRVTAAQLATRKTEVKDRIAALEAKRAAAINAHQSTERIDDQLEGVHEELNALTTAMVATGNASPDDLSDKAKTGKPMFTSSFPWLNDILKKANDNPTLALYKLQTSAHKFSWALIPLSLPFMWLLFAWKREYKLYDHLVFVTYSLSAVTLLFVLMALVSTMGIPTGWMMLAVPVHFYLQLKGAYALSRGSALWRTVALMIIAWTVLVLFALLVIALGLAH